MRNPCPPGFGNAANEGFGSTLDFLFEKWRAWGPAWRCRVCGKGASLRPAICSHCGASTDQFVRWIGRSAAWESLWEWVPEERLPTELREAAQIPDPVFEARVAAEVSRRIDSEFEARVRAAIETEITTLRGASHE